MKIGMDINSKAIQEYTNPQLELRNVSRTEKNSAARLDLSSNYLDTQAYTNHGKSMDELMLEAGAMDVELQRNYMTVMSNTMSGEDYKKAMEEGFDPSSMSGAESVTILDHIKAVMAESGQIVAGYNDNLDSEIMKEVTGKAIDTASIKNVLEKVDLPATTENAKKIQEAINMMDGINEIPEGSKKYMVDNDLDPTIGNIYTSRYSAMDDGSRQSKGYYAQDMGGYYAKKADEIDWDTMKPQVEKALEQMDMEDISKEEQIENAKWLLLKGLPVTEEKIKELATINKIDFPISLEKIVNVSIQAIAAGLEPKDGNLATKNNGIYEKAFEQQKAVIKANIGREEARLQLSLDANIRLVKQGKSIDTDSIENIIEALKKEEEQLRRDFFGDGDIGEINAKAETFIKTTGVIKELPLLPAATVASFAFAKTSYSVMDLHSAGSALKSRYEQASMSYETMGTEVRKDLGDSIVKAFRNIDDILKDLNLNVNEENQRAVRILGYNNMVINEDQIKKIVQADSKIQNVIRNLTPGKTLQLIRNGINPLDMSIDELVENIDKLDHDPKRDAEKYSKFLYKLEKSNEITESEKESYIGIYRLLNRLEKTDHASIGRLIDSGTDITFGNLLTAMRSAKKTFDISINDDFGALSEIITGGTSISDQIEAAFIEQISPENNEQLEKSYIEEKLTLIKESSEASTDVIEEILENDATVSSDNIEAVMQFNEEPNSLFRYMRAYSRRIDTRTPSSMKMAEKLDKEISDFSEKMTDKESAGQGYKSLIDTMTDTLETMSDIAADTYIDYKSINLMYKQLTVAANFSTQENYHVPVVLDGRLTDINVKLIHGEETGFVSAKLSTEKYGTVKAEIRLSNNKLDAVFIGESRENIDGLKITGDTFMSEMEKEGYQNTEIRFVVGNPNVMGKYSDRKADNNNETVDTTKLYTVARKFIQSIQITG